MPHIRLVRTDVHSRHRIGTGDAIQHQGSAVDGCLRAFRCLADLYGAAVGTDTTALADGLGINETRGILSQMHHSGTGIQVLSLTGKSDAGKFRMGSVTL